MVFCYGSGRGKLGYYMDLALEASNSAIIIDNHLLGRSDPEFNKYIGKLAERLYEMSRKYEPTSENMMAHVIWPNQEDWKSRSMDDVRLHTWLFAKELETFRGLPKERQEELRDVCLDLSIVAQRNTMPLVLMKRYVA